MATDPNETPDAPDDAAAIDEPTEPTESTDTAAAAEPASADGDAPAEAAGAATEEDEAAAAKAKEKAERKAKADAVVAQRTVTRRTVTSRRVTPKGGAAAPTTETGTKARDAKKTESVTARTPTPPSQQVYAKGPSPWWVPALMFALLIIGALIIMANYMLDDASNVRLVVGLGFILGGIITATQYR